MSSNPDYPRLEAFTRLSLTSAFKFHHSRLAGRSFPVGKLNFELQYQDGYTLDDYIQRFLTVDDILAQWQYLSCLNEFAKHFTLCPEFVDPDRLIPLAETAAGCIYVAVGGFHIDSVYHCDNGDFGICRVADKLDTFIESLPIPES